MVNYDLPSLRGKLIGASLADIYMSGDLYKKTWLSSSAEFSTEKVAAGFSQLPDIKNTFEEQFGIYSKKLNNMFEDVFKYQFSLLPLEDKQLIERGKVTTFSLEAPTLNNGNAIRHHKIADYIATGAVIIRAELEGKVAHYLYSPAQGRILKDADPSRPGLQFPGAHLYFTLPRPGSPGETESTVDIHWQLAGRPALDVTARRIYPSKSLETTLPKAFLGSVPGVTSPKLSELATVVGAHYTRGLDGVKKTAKGQTQQERDSEFHAAVHEFLLNFLPFYSAIKSFSQGKIGEGYVNLVLDVFGLVVPAVRSGFHAVKAGATGLQSFLKFTKAFAVTGARAANPLANVFDLGRGVFKLGAGSFKKLSTFTTSSVERLRSINAPSSGSFNLSKLGGKENIAEGVYRRVGENAEQVPAQAVQREGKWYAFDAHTHSAYGAPLKDFTPEPSSAVTQQLIGAGVGLAVDTVFSVTNSMLHKYLNQRSLPSVVNPEPEEPVPTTDELKSAVPVVRAQVAPAILRRLEAAKSDITRLENRSLELSTRDPLANHYLAQQWEDDPQELVERMESALCWIEDRTENDVSGLDVSFKPLPFYSGFGEDPDELEKQLAVIEQKIANLKKAQAQLSKLRNSKAA